MSIIKKFASAALTATVLGAASFGAIQPATAAPAPKPCSTADFTDAKPGSTHYNAITWLRCEGLSSGYTDGSYRTGRDITRGEVAQLLYRYSGEKHNAGSTRDFTDVKPGGSGFTAVSWMKERGITNGYSNGSFGYNEEITRGELSAFLYRYADENFSSPSKSPYTDMKKGSNFYDSATWLHSTKLVSGYADGSFKPNRDVTRGETAAFMYAMESRNLGYAPTYTVKTEGTGGSGGAYADTKAVKWSNGSVSSNYHIYANHLNGKQAHGVMFYMHGDGGWEYDYPNSGSPTGEYIKIARENNLLLVVPHTPDKQGSETWWEHKSSGKWATDLFDHLGTKYNVNLNETYWVGFSGGADVITEQIMQTHSDGWKGGAALIIGGGAGEWGYLGEKRPISSGLKNNFKMHWLVGSDDHPGAGAGDDGYDALRAAKDGHKYYTGLGMKTKLNIIPGAGHVDAAWDGPAYLRNILSGKA